MQTDLQAILDATMDVVAVFDSDRRFVSVNEAACRFYGHPREEIVGRRLDELIAFLQAVADQVAVLVENLRLMEELRGKAILEERQRIARELQRRGIAPDLIEGVLSDRSRDAELESALDLLAQRAPTVNDDRDRDRAWRLLVRRGYEVELAYEAVRRHASQSGGERRAA